MFVVFEGIDGGGKTTLSNLVASRLRDGGLRVAHVREGGKFASAVTQSMRELGRDARNLALTPRAELMLYLTREVQLVDEATRPAIASMDVVIADRYVFTAEVLAIYGRGLPAAQVEPLVRAAAADVQPDLVILVDVDPAIARARRRVSKLLAPDDKPPSRKGLAGTALQQRLRRGYRELAARDPARWLVLDNTDADLEATADALVALVRAGGAASARGALAGSTRDSMLRGGDHGQAREALIAWVDRRAIREPGLAAYFLDGLWGDAIDDRRRALGLRVPAVIAAGLRSLDDSGSWELRRQLAMTAPDQVARSLVGAPALRDEASTLLRALAPHASRGVADALVGRDDEVAWELRAVLRADHVMASLAGVPGARGWELRERWLAARGGAASLEVAAAALAAISVEGLADDRAWEVRKAVRTVAPVAALESTAGLADDRSWRWRERDLERAPKPVMKTIAAVDDPRAWAFRERVVGRCEEALDSIVGLDDPRAWAMRAVGAELWPATVVKSLGPLAAEARGHALVAELLARYPEDVALWRQATVQTSPAHPSSSPSSAMALHTRNR